MREILADTARRGLGAKLKTLIFIREVGVVGVYQRHHHISRAVLQKGLVSLHCVRGHGVGVQREEGVRESCVMDREIEVHLQWSRF